jgi:hypothetical protein
MVSVNLKPERHDIDHVGRVAGSKGRCCKGLNLWVQDGLKCHSGIGISKHEVSHGSSIQACVARDHTWPPNCIDFCEGLATLLGQSVCEVVSIKGGHASSAEGRHRSGFPSTDAAGEDEDLCLA